jgi:hypothetical protein
MGDVTLLVVFDGQVHALIVCVAMCRKLLEGNDVTGRLR